MTMQTVCESNYRGAAVLVTGGLGFIGSCLVRRLADLGAAVTAVDSLIPEYGGNLFNVHGLAERITINIADVRDRHAIGYLVQGKTHLFNLAGQTSHMDSMHDPYTDLEINCRAQLSILEACRKHNPGIKIVFASTRQMYGKPEYLPVDEKHLLRPVDVNGINKMAGEWYHILYNNVHGIRACALRLTNTYGPRMRIKDARQTFLGDWIRRLVLGEPIEVWGGEQLRDFTYVEDAVDAFLLAGATDTANGLALNLGSDEVISLLNLADLMVEVNGGGERICKQFPKDRKRIDIGDYYAAYAQAEAVLGWRPRTSLREGLAQSLDYFRKHGRQYLDCLNMVNESERVL